MGTGLQQLTPDTYRLSRVDGAGVYRDADAMKAAIAEEANRFAAKQGKIAIPVASHEETLRGHLLTADLEFRLATPGEAAALPAAHSPPAVTTPVAPALVGAAAAPLPPAAPPALPATATPAAAQPAATATPNFYNELIMLDDLRKRGILTDAEFQALKTKLIAGK